MRAVSNDANSHSLQRQQGTIARIHQFDALQSRSHDRRGDATHRQAAQDVVIKLTPENQFEIALVDPALLLRVLSTRGRCLSNFHIDSVFVESNGKSNHY